MTIYRQADINLSQRDNLDVTPPPGSNVYFNTGVFETRWHMHACHQLIYAESGVIHIRTQVKQMLLPAQHGVWIPAGCAHSLHSNSATLKICSVYFYPQHKEEPKLESVRVFKLPPLAHEMLLYCQRWLDDDQSDRLKESYFQTLRLLVLEWCDQSLALELPLSDDPLIVDVTEYLLEQLEQPLTLDQVGDRFGVSGRTLMRHFQSRLGMTFGRYLQVARIARAAELLTLPDATVTDVALATGYRSLSSFSQAFQLLIGQPPSEYLRGKQSLRE